MAACRASCGLLYTTRVQRMCYLLSFAYCEFDNYNAINAINAKLCISVSCARERITLKTRKYCTIPTFYSKENHSLPSDL